MPRHDRRRILAELRDHIECDAESVHRLGSPSELADMFADELATARTRHSAFRAFAALSAVAAVLAFSQLAVGSAGHPGFRSGVSLALFFPALIGMLIAPQAALVSGTLACVRALRRRRCALLPAAELALIARRTRVALISGGLTVLGIEAYVLDFSLQLRSWWLVTVGATVAVAGGGLVAAWRDLGCAGAITTATPGPAGDVFDDLPAIGFRWLRARPWRLGAIASMAVGLLMTVFAAHAERSLTEGIQRGVVEGLVAALGFAVLGKAIGVMSPRGALALHGSIAIGRPGHRVGDRDHRVGDRDREHAETMLQAGYADGRLSLQELTARIEAVHTAQTLGELRGLLADLPDTL